MTVAARATAPLARFDPAWNALSDATVRWVPWTWWPLEPPRADRPYGWEEHAVVGAWVLASFTITEVLVARQPEAERRTGAKLVIDRALSLAIGVAGSVAAAGAWDRRAERLRRRPWRRLLGVRG